MFRGLKYFCAILQIGGCILPIYASPVTNFNSGTKSDTFVFELPKTQDAQSLFSRVSSLSASGSPYGDTSIQSQARNPSSANGRILSQPSTPDKDAITYPDDVSRDSYGNIVTPYTTLVEDAPTIHASSSKPVNIGLLTDVNKDKGQQLQFVIPSYSDGITEIQGPYKPSHVNTAIAPPIQTLLPPLSSGNYNYPSLVASSPTVDNSYQNEIGGSFSSTSQNNPLPTGPTTITTNGHIGSANNSPNIYTPNLQVPFSSPSAVGNQPTSFDQQSGVKVQPQPSQPISSSSSSAATLHGTSDFSAIHVSSPELNAPSSTFPFSNTKPLKDTQFVNQIPVQIQVDSGKYTGGFGGAPGILGDQKNQGYAVKPTVNKPSSSLGVPQISNDHLGINSIHSNTGSSSSSHVTQATIPHVPIQTASPTLNYQVNPTPAKPVAVNPSGTFGQSNTNHGSFQFGTAFSTIPTQNTQITNGGKYTGGFGGPPGILAPFDNVKSGKNLAIDNSSTSSIGTKRKY